MWGGVNKGAIPRRGKKAPERTTAAGPDLIRDTNTGVGEIGGKKWEGDIRSTMISCPAEVQQETAAGG